MAVADDAAYLFGEPNKRPQFASQIAVAGTFIRRLQPVLGRLLLKGGI